MLLKKVERVLKKIRTSSDISVLQKKVKYCVVSLGFEPMISNILYSNVSLYDVTEPHGLNYRKAQKSKFYMSGIF